MAILRPAIYEHNNSVYPIVDSNFLSGGFRTAVVDLSALYALSSNVNQLKERATIVYVSDETKYYILIDASNVGNINGWEEFQTGGGVGTITGATNGLTLAGVSGATVILGGNLTGNTIIDGLGTSNFTFNNINDFQITPSGSSAITFGVDEDGLLYTFTDGSISYETNQGMLYGGKYHTNYVNRSLVDKEYVDIVATGFDPKSAVNVATTINIVLSGLSTIDGYAVQNGDRVLVKNQSSGATNGIYIATGVTWNRATDFDNIPEGEVTEGALIPVISGDTNNNTLWILITPDPIIIGTTVLDFTFFSKPTIYTAGTGITINEYVINVDGASLAGNSIVWTGITPTFNVDVTSGTLGAILDTKLNIIDFNIYSGITDTRIITNENNIIYISGITDTKLNTNIFTSYTATTQPIIDSAITGASEGICKYDGHNICLGGVISNGSAIIDLENSYLQIGCWDGYNTTGGTLMVGGWGVTPQLSYAGLAYCNISDDKNALMQVLYAGSVLLCASSGMTSKSVTLEYDKAFEYGANYCTDYTNRSLVDKEYVDNSLSTFTNERVTKTIDMMSHGFAVNDIIGWSGGTYNKAIADGTYDGEIVGIVSDVISVDVFDLTQSGYISGFTGLVTNSTYFVSDVVAGEIIITAPTITNHIIRPILIANSSESAWVLPYRGSLVIPSVIGGGSGERVSKSIDMMSHGFVVNNVIGWSGGTYNKAIADGTYDGEVIGIVSNVDDVDTFDLIQSGYFSGFTGLTINSTYFLSDTVAGEITLVEPITIGHIIRPILIANSIESGWVFPYPGYEITPYNSGSTSGGTITGATNGLTVINGGTSIALGGDLTGATIINLCDNGLRLQSDTTSCGLVDFSLNTTYNNSKFGICSCDMSGAQWGLSGNSTSISTYHCLNSSNGSSIAICNTGLTLTNKSSSELKSVSLNTNALVYGDCYHSGYTHRSLIDKEFLDIEMSGTSNVINVHVPPIGASYTTQRYDDLIPVSGISSNEIYLYPTPVLGQRVIIVDVCGNASIDPIIINGNGKYINKTGICSTINTDFGSVTFVWNNYFWSAIAFIN